MGDIYIGRPRQRPRSRQRGLLRPSPIRVPERVLLLLLKIIERTIELLLESFGGGGSAGARRARGGAGDSGRVGARPRRLPLALRALAIWVCVASRGPGGWRRRVSGQREAELAQCGRREEAAHKRCECGRRVVDREEARELRVAQEIEPRVALAGAVQQSRQLHFDRVLYTWVQCSLLKPAILTSRNIEFNLLKKELRRKEYQINGQSSKKVNQMLATEWLTPFIFRRTPVFEKRNNFRISQNLFDKILLRERG